MIPPHLLACLLFSFVQYSGCSQKPTETPKSSGIERIEGLHLVVFQSDFRSVLHDSKGNYWIGSHSDGICRIDGVESKYFTTADGLSGNQIRAIYEDAAGSIWAETDRGPCKFVDDGFFAPSLPVQFERPTGLLTDNNDLWFNAGNQHGTYRFNGTTWQAISFPAPPGTISAQLLGMTNITQEPNGKPWFATYSIAFGLNPMGWEVINDSVLGLEEANVGLHIRSILFDSEGNLWLGNNGIGVIKWRDNQATFFSREMGLTQAGGYKGGALPAGTLEHVFAIEEDELGNIWFGDRDTGAWKFDGESVVHYVVDASLPSPDIWQIYQDPNGDLLFVMAQGGIYRFLGEDFERLF